MSVVGRGRPTEGRGRLAQGPACSAREWPARHVPARVQAGLPGLWSVLLLANLPGASPVLGTLQEGRAEDTVGFLSLARPCVAPERGAPSRRAMPRRRHPLRTQAGRQLRPPNQELRPSRLLPSPATQQYRRPRPAGVCSVPRAAQASGTERPSPRGWTGPGPPRWFPRRPGLRGHPSRLTPSCPGRGVAAAVPLRHTTSHHVDVPSTHTCCSHGARLGPPNLTNLLWPPRAPTLGRGSGWVLGRGAGGPHTRRLFEWGHTFLTRPLQFLCCIFVFEAY